MELAKKNTNANSGKKPWNHNSNNYRKFNENDTSGKKPR